MRAVVQRVASASVEVMQKNYGVLLVSQFTLYGILKGNKPDFHLAMSPERAKPFYTSVVDKFRRSYNPDAVKECSIGVLYCTATCGIKSDTYDADISPILAHYGIFGAMMKVNLVNDGPVTMQIDSSQPSKNTTDAVEEP
ncbi:hypothetical protein TEA_016709 [Camellia sinensis var. sinensis]|uniref:D-aminoacyl-tRNA deacylase n=1 Tax=Camellia sinensis var. sinensis TaxID=542762 RepID=A0A4S4E207_CAMSN|nr:hypothetical protein TEA_016709 [Camellia sinensis var. sinensis]